MSYVDQDLHLPPASSGVPSLLAPDPVPGPGSAPPTSIPVPLVLSPGLKLPESRNRHSKVLSGSTKNLPLRLWDSSVFLGEDRGLVQVSGSKVTCPRKSCRFSGDVSHPDPTER